MLPVATAVCGCQGLFGVSSPSCEQTNTKYIINEPHKEYSLFDTTYPFFMVVPLRKSNENETNTTNETKSFVQNGDIAYFGGMLEYRGGGNFFYVSVTLCQSTPHRCI